MNELWVLGRVALVMLVLASVTIQLLKWWRVLQREHYHAGSTVVFFWRWIVTTWQGDKTSRAVTRLLRAAIKVVLVLGVVILFNIRRDAFGALIVALVALTFPPRLSIRGRSSALVWTRRMVTVAIVTAGLVALLFLLATLYRPWLVASLVLVAGPFVTDVAALLTAPLENQRANKYVRQAAARLAVVQPDVVAITGSCMPS